MNVIETDRLILRTWRAEDAEAFYQLNQDPHVQEYLPFPWSRERATQFVADMNERFAQHRYTSWAVEEKASGEFIGFVGFQAVIAPFPCAPAIEIGWRLAYPYWGRGYATEAAKACLEYGSTVLGLREIVSFTTVPNMRSRRVMEKIGMQQVVGGDFMHPRLAPEHPLALHVLYKIELKTSG